MFDAKKRNGFLTVLSGLALVAITTVTIGCQWEHQEKETVTQTQIQTQTQTATQTVTTTAGAVTQTVTTTAPGTTQTVTVEVPAPTEGSGPEIELALIYDALVSFDDSSTPQVFVYIRGGLPDSCTTLHEIKVEYLDLPPEVHSGGKTVKITVTTERPKDVECAQGYSFFEEHLTLSIDFIRGETYLLEVNGVATLFRVP